MPDGELTIDDVLMLPADDVELEGHLAVPEGADGLVIFAHGSGSSRHSPRNRHVAEMLRDGGLGTLLVDLLTAEEESVDIRTGNFRFDIALLAERVAGLAEWSRRDARTGDLNVGLFGSSTGAAAALRAAARLPGDIAAVVSRGGRPDLADAALGEVESPTLLIVGGRDEPVIHMNREAKEQMHAPVELKIVPGASHLFEEHGKLDQVARLARSWFLDHLTSRRGHPRYTDRPRP